MKKYFETFEKVINIFILIKFYLKNIKYSNLYLYFNFLNFFLIYYRYIFKKNYFD